jgi:hypothetical protein
MIASIFFMSNLMEFEEISAKMRLERNRGAGQSISLPEERGGPGFSQSNRHAVRGRVMPECAGSIGGKPNKVA